MCAYCVYLWISASRITVCFGDNRYFCVCFVLALFHRGPAKILAVNTCMRHLKPLQFIGLVSADTAWLSKSSVCADKHWSFWRHGTAYRADTPHLLRTRGGKNWSSLCCLFLSLTLFLFFSGCLSLPASPTPQYFMPFRDYLVFPSSTAANPIKLGFVRKAVIQNLSVVFS